MPTLPEVKRKTKQLKSGLVAICMLFFVLMTVIMKKKTKLRLQNAPKTLKRLPRFITFSFTISTFYSILFLTTSEEPSELSLQPLCVYECVQWFVWAWSDAFSTPSDCCCVSFMYSVNNTDAITQPTKDSPPAVCGRTRKTAKHIFVSQTENLKDCCSVVNNTVLVNVSPCVPNA